MQTVYRNLEPETVNYFSLSGATGDQFLLNENIKLIKYGAGISLSSIVCNLSTVNGTAFVTNPVFTTTGVPSNDLRWAVGFKHSLVAAAKTLVGWGKAAGTGETTTNLYTSDFSVNANSWNTAQGTLAGNIDTIGGQDNNLRFTIDGNNSEHKSSRNVAGHVTGAVFTGEFNYYIPAAQSNIDGITLDMYVSRTLVGVLGTWTQLLVTFTGVSDTGLNAYAKDGTSYSFQDAGADDVFYLRGIVVNKVLTPSATGVTIQASKTDATQNWTSNDGIDPNAASFVDTITAS